jgi:transglutaminase-like putative cysteine protease
MKVEPKIAKEAVYGNEFAYFEFKEPQGAQIIRHQFKVKTWELHWDLDPKKVERIAQWPNAFQPYLRSDSSVTINDQLRTVLRQIVPESKGGGHDVRSIMTWVNQSITYDHTMASLQASSLHALEKKRGHCSDYHGLCAAFGRALGYPARVAYGINPFPKNSPSHCKLEVFLPPYGWVSFDVSETQRLVADIQKDGTLGDADKAALVAAAQERLARGFRDNTWFLQTRGTDYDLAPPAAKKVAVVRTIHAEADGVALPEPDPGDKTRREFSWMTSHSYTPDVKVTYPFKDVKSLLPPK